MTHQLNELSLEDLYLPICAICKYKKYSSKTDMDIKPLKLIMNDLVQQCFDLQSQDENQVSQDLKELQNKLVEIARICSQLYENIENYNIMFKEQYYQESESKKMVREILNTILKNPGQEIILREQMRLLENYTYVKDGILKVDNNYYDKYKENLMERGNDYIQKIKVPIEGMYMWKDTGNNLLREFPSYNNILDSQNRDIQNFHQLITMSKLQNSSRIHPSNKSQIQQSQDIENYIPSQFESRNISPKKQKDNEQNEIRKQTLKREMLQHIQDCENKHCNFVDDAQLKIKWWKTLYIIYILDDNNKRQIVKQEKR